MTIPHDAVERAAKVMWIYAGPVPEFYKDKLRAALTAALEGYVLVKLAPGESYMVVAAHGSAATPPHGDTGKDG